MEDRISDRREGYKLGFDLILIPSVKVHNSFMSFSVKIGFLSWELVIYFQKRRYYIYEDGRVRRLNFFETIKKNYEARIRKLPT